MAPMIVIELLWLFDTEIQQLHLDITLDPAKVLDQIITTTEKTSEFLAVDIGHMDTLQSTILEFPGNQLRIYLIGLGMFLLALSMDIGRVHYQRTPTIRFKGTMRRITATTCLVCGRYLIIRKMLTNIIFKLIWGRDSLKKTCQRTDPSHNVLSNCACECRCQYITSVMR